MKTHNPNNERIKRQYFIFIKEVKRQSESSVGAVAKALNRFEVYTKRRDFKAFHFQQAVAFKKHLAEQKGRQSGRKLSKATLNATLVHLLLFPATRVALGDTRQFEAAGLERRHWRSAAPIRTIFRDAFSSASLPYYNPHSLRNTLVRLGETVCQTPEDFKAWSQNLGHGGGY